MWAAVFPPVAHHTSPPNNSKMSEESLTHNFVPDDRDRHFRTEHLQENLGARTARGGVVTLSAQLCKFGLSTLSAIVLARLLTPQDYGLIGMVAIIVGFLGMFQYMGLSTATLKWSELTHDQVTSLFWM